MPGKIHKISQRKIYINVHNKPAVLASYMKLKVQSTRNSCIAASEYNDCSTVVLR